MKVRYDPDFLTKLKRGNILVRNSFIKRIALFATNPYDPQLHNHALQRNWTGYRSIDITADYRAVNEELHAGEEIIAYFISIGAHKELYETN